MVQFFFYPTLLEYPFYSLRFIHPCEMLSILRYLGVYTRIDNRAFHSHFDFIQIENIIYSMQMSQNFTTK